MFVSWGINESLIHTFHTLLDVFFEVTPPAHHFISFFQPVLSWPSFSAAYSSRTRRILQEAHEQGRPCPSQLAQTKPCFIRPCYRWLISDWSPCTLEVRLFIYSHGRTQRHCQKHLQLSRSPFSVPTSICLQERSHRCHSCLCTCAGRPVWRGASEAEPDVRGPLGGLAGVCPSTGAVGVLRRRTSEEDPAGDGKALLHPLSRWNYSQRHLIRFASPQSAEDTGPLPQYYSHQHQLIKWAAFVCTSY